MKKRAVCMLASLLIPLTLTACGGGVTNVSSKKEASSSPAATAPAKPTDSGASKAKTVDSLKLTMAGGSAGGFWSLLGEGIGNILRQSVPNTQFSYETGSGVKNIMSVVSSKIPLGIAFTFEVKSALDGEEPFKEKVPEVYALANIYNNAPTQIAISKDFSEKYGIKSMEDIAAKKPPIRIGVNQRGNLVEKVNRTIFEAYGVSYEDIKKWGGNVYYEAWKPAADMMKDNKLDWTADPVFVPDSTLMELSASKDIMLLPINEKAQKLLQERLGMEPGVIKAGSYKWQPGDTITSNAGAVILADPKMSVDEAYTITKVLVENIKQYRDLHTNLKDHTPEIMANVAPAKLHPGAEKYFKEIGVIK